MTVTLQPWQRCGNGDNEAWQSSVTIIKAWHFQIYFSQSTISVVLISQWSWRIVWGIVAGECVVSRVSSDSVRAARQYNIHTSKDAPHTLHKVSTYILLQGCTHAHTFRSFLVFVLLQSSLYTRRWRNRHGLRREAQFPPIVSRQLFPSNCFTTTTVIIPWRDLGKPCLMLIGT